MHSVAPPPMAIFLALMGVVLTLKRPEGRRNNGRFKELTNQIAEEVGPSN